MHKPKSHYTQENILWKFETIHGKTYSYENVIFTAVNKYVSITCKEHGNFNQKPAEHIKGRGCRKCAVQKMRDSPQSFIEKAQIIFGKEYDYSLLRFDGMLAVDIKCQKHGLFTCWRSNHLQGHKCDKCAIELQHNAAAMPKDSRIMQAKAVHGERYDYSFVETGKNHAKVSINCKTHGIFRQKWCNHIWLSQGCPKCNYCTGRYSHEYFVMYPKAKLLKANLYVIKYNEGGRVFYKIGISKNWKKRLKIIPYIGIQLVLIEGPLYEMFCIEQDFLKSYGYRNRYSPAISFGGDKECFILPEKDILLEINHLSHKFCNPLQGNPPSSTPSQGKDS